MSSQAPPTKPRPKPENPLTSILFNIILPVMVLNQLTKRLGENGPTIALVIALAFPIAYGAADYIKRRHKNYISLLGIINILFTGGFALFELYGIWFAIKEAAFPLVMGIGVFISGFTRKPLMQALAYNDNVMNLPLINEKLQLHGNQQKLKKHLQQSTFLLAISFFLSSLLNFILAKQIFKNIDPALSALERSTLLNDQIAKMTWMSYIVIVVPLLIFMMFILWHLISGIKKFTGLKLDEIIHQSHGADQP